MSLLRTSLCNFLCVSVPLAKPPPPFHVTQMCSGAISVKRHRERDASVILTQVSLIVSHSPCFSLSSTLLFWFGLHYIILGEKYMEVNAAVAVNTGA